VASLFALLGLAVLAPAPLAQARPRRHRPRLGPLVSVVLTTRNLRYALTAMPPLRFQPGLAGSFRGRGRALRARRSDAQSANAHPAHAQVLRVQDSVRYQRILGFGAAMTDSAAWLLWTQLSPAARARAFALLFGRRHGIALDLVRVPIGASDFTATGVPYSYDDLPAGESDPTLTHFSIAHDLAYIIPALRAALATNPRALLLASEWSPPPWMKANDAFDNLGGTGTLLPGDYPVLAAYLVRFLQAYAAVGVPIWALSPQNEPMATSAYPGMELSPSQESALIVDDLAPDLRAAGLQTRLLGSDSASLGYATALEQSPAAGDLFGIAWHCYGGQQAIGAFHQRFPAVLNLTTECSPGIIPYGTVEAALSALNNSASGVLLWNLALDGAGGPVQPPNSGCPHCTGLITVSRRRQSFTPTLGLYQFGALSRFIQRGAVRVAVTRPVHEWSDPGLPAGRWRWGVTPGLDDVAAINPGGERVLVVHDNSARARRFVVAWRRWRFRYRLPGWGTVTFRWR
jgi:glucosylceramidase